MKIKTLEAEVNMRYTLPKSELNSAALRIRREQRSVRRHSQDETASWRTITVFHDDSVRWAKTKGETDRHTYGIRFEYSPATELTWELWDQDKVWLMRHADLPLKDAHFDITPSGLLHFRKKWSLSEGWRRVDSPDAETGNGFYVGIEIMGFLSDEKQIKELRDLSDTLYLPGKYRDHSYETKTGSGGTGGPHPTIILNKHFTGDITREAERQVTDFYRSIQDFVLKYEVIEGFRFEEGGKTLAELEKDRSGLDMHEHIVQSDVGHNGFYAPHLRIDAYQPHGTPIPKFRWDDGEYKTIHEVDLMCLTTFAETIMPLERGRSTK